MNKVYRIVWNAAAGLWQVAAEFTRGRRKAAADWRLPLAAGALLLIAPPTLADLPDGGVVVGGSGAIRRSGNELTVTQNSQRLAIDWQSFSIGEGDSVRFVQPSREAAALNRVLGPDVSRILGSLDANGQVFLVNPNGVLFGANARVDVGGLVASTLDIRTEDFLAGDYRFEGDGAGSVINKGALQAAEGGYVALIAARIENAGSIEAERGQVLMGAGRKVRLDFGGPVKLEVEEAALETCIEQGGAVRADGGLIYLSAHSASELASTVINHSGVSQARSLEIGDDGEVVLLGEGATVAVTGTLDVSSARGAGGKAVVSGGRVLVDSGALIDASGAYGGGEIYLGGGWQGQDPEIPQAKGTVIMHDATVDASATEFGDGGIVAAWSDVNDNDSVTRVAGTLRARGGAQGGEGGRIETSGRELGVEAAPDVSASRGRGGEWLVDPHNITIVAGDGASGINAASPFESSGDGATLGVELIDAALASGDVVIRTGSGGSQDGDITWNPDYEYAGAADRQLSLHAHRNVALNGSIASSNGALSMTFNADSDGDGNGNLTIKGSLATRGGDLSLSGQAITADVRYVTLTTSGGAGGDVDIAVAGTLLLKEVDLIAGGTGTINIDASGPNGRVELNAAKVIVEDGDLVVDAGSQILQLWRAVFASSGAGDISLTARTGNIRAGVGGTSTGHIRATGDGDIFLRSNNLLLPENSSIEGGASLFILPYDADTSIGLGDGAAGGLKLSAADLSRLDGFSLVTVGEASGSGAIELGAAELAAALRVRTGGGVTVMDEFSADAIELIAGGRVAVDSGSLSSHGGDVVITADGAFTMADGARISTGGGDFSADYGGAAQTDSVSGRIETSGGDLSLAVADSMSEDTRLYLRGATLLSEGGNILVDVGVPGGSAGELRVHALGGRNTVIDSGQGDLTLRMNNTESWLLIEDGAELRAHGGGSITLDSEALLSVRSGSTVAAVDGELRLRSGGVLEIGPSGHGSAGLSSTNGAVVLDAGAGFSGMDGDDTLQAPRMLLLGAADYDFSNGGFQTDAVAADIAGALSIANSGALSIGSINGVHGVRASGPVALSTASGDLTVAQTITTTDASSAAIVLNAGAASGAGDAGGGDLVIQDEADLLTGVGGRAVLYTGSLSGSAAAAARLGAGSGRFRYDSDESVSNFSAALGDGIWLIYREQPWLSVNPHRRSSVYGDAVSLAGLSYSLNGLLNGDDLTLAGIGDSAVFETDAVMGSNAGDYDIRYVNGLHSALGYGFEDGGAGGEYTIARRQISLSGERVYDGGSVLDAAVFELHNLALGETLGLSGQASMTDKHAGLGKAVILEDLTLVDGAGLASNYLLAGGSVNIAPAAITVSSDPVTKIYDSGTAAAGRAILTAGELFDTDTLAGGDFAFTDENAGENKTVTVANVVVNDGNNGHNYLVSYVDNTESKILRRAVTVSGITAADKVYDGEVAALIDVSGARFDELAPGDELIVSASGEFDSPDAGDRTVWLDSVYSGADLRNYEITDQPSAKAAITPRVLSLSGSRVYDGSVALAASIFELSNLAASESLMLIGEGKMADRHVGDDKIVDASGLALADGSGLASNYTLAAGDHRVDISPRPIGVAADWLSKIHGSLDPVLSWRLTAGSLAPGDTLLGALRREPGESPGIYRIDRGSLDHPDYDIDFQSGQMRISTSEQVRASTIWSGAAETAQSAHAGFTDPSVRGELAVVELKRDDDRPHQQPGEDAASDSRMRLFVIAGGIRMPYQE